MAVSIWLFGHVMNILKKSSSSPRDSSFDELESVRLVDPEVHSTTHIHNLRKKLPTLKSLFFPSWRALKLSSSTRSSRLAYLDGLRGVASLMVFFIHNQGWSHNEESDYYRLDNAFGWNGEYHIATFPGLRLLFTGGELAVSIFFVISGYVLSYSPLRSIHAGDRLKAGNTLSSALFRRWFRLYLPVAATTFLCITSWHIFRIRSSQTGHERGKSYGLELWWWQRTFKDYSFIWSGRPWLSHNDHAWSIAYEFRGSIVVFTVLMAFSHVRHHIRLFLNLILVWYFTYVVDGWYLSLFCIGMLLCDLDMLAEAGNLSHSRLFNLSSPWKTRLFSIAILGGIYIGGVPGTGLMLDNLRQNPGWYWLSFMVPSALTDPRRIFHITASTLIVGSVSRLSTLRRWLESTFCQYLGVISYGLYLVHGPILWTVGDRVYAALGRSAKHHAEIIPNWIDLFPLPSWGPLGLELNHIVAQLIILPFTVWVADLVTKYIDEPSVKFAQSLLKATEDDDSRKQPGVRLT